MLLIQSLAFLEKKLPFLENKELKNRRKNIVWLLLIMPCLTSEGILLAKKLMS